MGEVIRLFYLRVLLLLFDSTIDMPFFSRRRGTSTADELPASSGCRQCRGRPLNLKLSTRPAQFYKFRSRIQRRHSLLIVVSARASCVVAIFHNFCQSYVKKRAEDCADRSATTLCHRPVAGVDTGLSIACSGFIPQVENQNRDQVIFPRFFHPSRRALILFYLFPVRPSPSFILFLLSSPLSSFSPGFFLLLCVSFSLSFSVFSPFPGVPIPSRFRRHPPIERFAAQFELKTAILPTVG